MRTANEARTELREKLRSQPSGVVADIITVLAGSTNRAEVVVYNMARTELRRRRVEQLEPNGDAALAVIVRSAFAGPSAEMSPPAYADVAAATELLAGRHLDAEEAADQWVADTDFDAQPDEWGWHRQLLATINL